MNEATNASAGPATSSLGVRELAELAVDDHADLVGERRRVLVVVRDEQRRQRELAQQLVQLAADGRLRVRVERGERLVEEQHARVARERARERDALALAAGERRRAARSRGARSEAARGTRRRARCPRTRRSAARSCAGRARTPGRRARRAARPAAGRRRALASNQTSSPSAIRPRCGRTSPAIARSTDVLPAPDGPTSATVRSTSSASSSSNERRGSGEVRPRGLP